MGSCFSVECAEDGERKEPTETSQVALADAVKPSALEVMGEAAHADLISNQQVAEKNVHCKMMTYADLYKATEGFRDDLFLGEGGFGPVYKGFLDSTNQEVAIKILNLQGKQGDKEFLTEVTILGKLHHPNLVKLLGCCADRGQRLLVYEFMPLGSLFNHIHDLPPDKEPLDWSTRIEILLGTAKGLQHLHDKANPPVINRDVKCGNILLGEGYHPKLSDFGLAKLGPTGDDTHISTSHGFGVVMLEVLTGRKAKDESLPAAEQNLAVWAVNLVNARDLNARNFDKLADPALQGQYHKTSFIQALLVAVLCVSEAPNKRPRIAEVVDAVTQISESHKRRLARQQLAAPSTPTGTGSDGNQA